MESQPTTGGINVFSWSVGLDVGLNDVDLNEIRGRAVVAIICADCGHATIGKVLVGRDGLAWLNYFGAPHSEDYPERRRESDQRIPAPRVVLTHRMQGAPLQRGGPGWGVGYQLPDLWCEKHGRKAIGAADVTARMQQAVERRKVVRLAV